MALPNLEASMLLSLRRRGQLLLVTCALLGAVTGASLGMIVERAEAPSAVTVPARAREASGVAASPPGSQASEFQAVGQAGDGSIGQPNPVDRADRRHKPGKDGKHGRGTPADRGKGKPGKHKDK
jgi:hypothetical protein